MEKVQKVQYDKILRIIAEEEGITIEDAENELQRTIDQAFAHMDENARKKWEPLLEGDRPTVEEFINYMIELIKIFKKLTQ